MSMQEVLPSEKEPIGIINMSGVSGKSHTFQGDSINLETTDIKIIHNISSSTRETQSIWFDAREPVKFFTGRKEQLVDLHQKLQRHSGQGGIGLTVISQITSVIGLGGVGKSELARKYAQEYAKEYDGNVIWINSENNRSLSDSFFRLAKDKLNIATKTSNDKDKAIQSIVEETYQHFAQGKSLFIFDNAEQYRTQQEGDAGIDKFLPISLPPHANKPSIIITSRNQKWEEQITILSLDIFTEEEAIEFIKKALAISDTFQDEHIQQLADKLQRFPLALQQAVAYIKQKDELLIKIEEEFNISDYLKAFEAQTEKLLDFKFEEYSSDLYTKTTFNTWQVTLEGIKKKDGGQLALDILDIMAYFSSDNIIPKQLLNMAGQKEKLGDSLKWLKQYSMVIPTPQGGLSIHRLVQQVIIIGLKKEGNEEMTLKQALTLLNNALEVDSPENTRYIPHALTVWDYASNYEALVKDFSQLPYRIIDELDKGGKYQEAYPFAERASMRLEHVLGPEHLSTLMVQHGMASILEKQGRYDEALKLNQEVYEKREEHLGSDHPDTLKTQHNVALVLHLQGKYDESFELFQEVFKKQKEQLGSDHLDTLKTQHSMARVLHRQSQYKECFNLYQEVYEKRKQKLGSNHQETLKTQNNMAIILRHLGKNEEALKQYKEVYEKRKEQLGPTHPETLRTQQNIGSILYHQGQYDEALKIYHEVFEGRKEVLDPVHPSILKNQHNIAKVLNKQGQHEKALKLYQEVFEKKKEKLGPNHPVTLRTQYDIAIVKSGQGRHEEALELYQMVYKEQKERLGPDNSNTLDTLNGIAEVLERQGKNEEALKTYQEVCEKRKEKLGTDHPDVLKIRNCIAALDEKLK